MRQPNIVLRAAGLGAISGLRSMAGPASVSRAVANGELYNLEDTPFAALGSSRVPLALTVLEVGEFVGDKLPVMPSRTSLPPLLGRATSGALVGATLFVSGERNPAAGAALGAVSALAAAYAGEYLRAYAVEKTGVPDIVGALLEDGLVLLTARRLLRG